jgi:hypothetical protein
MFIVSEAQATRIKRRWWRLAKLELKAWAVVALTGTILGASVLKNLHWEWWGYVELYGVSLLVFSRLAWWIVFPTVMVVYSVWPNPMLSDVIGASILAAVARCPLFWWFMQTILTPKLPPVHEWIDPSMPPDRRDPVTGQPLHG